MTAYIEELEKQNEELRQKLAKCEGYTPRWHKTSPTMWVYASEYFKYAEMFVAVQDGDGKIKIRITYNERKSVRIIHESEPIDPNDRHKLKKIVETGKQNVEKTLESGEFGIKNNEPWNT